MSALTIVPDLGGAIRYPDHVASMTEPETCIPYFGKLDIADPYILVGHSYGGYVVRRFADAYPKSVSGIILIDSPDEAWSFAPEGLLDAQTIGAEEWWRGLAIQFGLFRLGTLLFPDRLDPLKGVPGDARGEQMALYLRSSRHFTIADEMAAYKAVPPVERGPYGFGRLGDAPLVIVSRGRNDPATGDHVYPEWEEAQKTFGFALDKQCPYRSRQERPHGSRSLSLGSLSVRSGGFWKIGGVSPLSRRLVPFPPNSDIADIKNFAPWAVRLICTMYCHKRPCET